MAKNINFPVCPILLMRSAEHWLW